jgi:pantothenate kinase-related protein Tda10
MIGGQKRALDDITSSIAGWEFRRKSGNADPLVLAISGPPGVGNSETGMLLILIQRRNTTSKIL